LLRSPEARRGHDAAAVTIPALKFNVRQSCTPRVESWAVDVAQMAAAAMPFTAETYDTAVQTAARGAVPSPSAVPRPPTGVTEPGMLDVVPLSVATGNVRVYFTACTDRGILRDRDSDL
jgi:hypothetical protein